ncbi:MAG: acyl-CoA thioesterase [Phycisphaerales bacterium]
MQPRTPIRSSGTLRLRVRYCECDPMGYVHHSAYLPWLEMARTEILREAGVTYREMEAAGFFLVIVKIECRYRKPGRYDDLVEVRARVERTGRVKIEHSYEVVRVDERASGGVSGGAEEVLMAATTTLGCVDGAGRVRELPEWLSRAGAK